MQKICNCPPCKEQRARKTEHKAAEARRIENARLKNEGDAAEAITKIVTYNYEQTWERKNKNAWRYYIQ